MKLFRFDPEVGQEIEQFGSVKAVISKVMHLEAEAVVNCVYVHPNGRIGQHQAATQQLFLLVQGEGWVRGETDEKVAVCEEQAIFWEQGEWHETGSENGMTAVIIDGIHIDTAELMSSHQKDEP